MMGALTKKQKLVANTPLKHFLRPIIEEAMMRRMQAMEGMQPPQLPTQVGGMVEPASISPLENALMSTPQSGGGGTTGSPQTTPSNMGGMP